MDLDPAHPAAGADHGRDADSAAPALEGVLVGASAELEPDPGMLDDVHARLTPPPGLEEVLDEALPERLDVLDRCSFASA